MLVCSLILQYIGYLSVGATSRITGALPKRLFSTNKFIHNSVARAVTKTAKYHHISPVLKSLHWLKINERIHYKILSLTYNILQTQQPSYRIFILFSLSNAIPTLVLPPSSLSRPAISSRLKITDRYFSHYAPVLWNKLPPDMRQPRCFSQYYVY